MQAEKSWTLFVPFHPLLPSLLHLPALGHLCSPAPARLKVQAMHCGESRIRVCSSGHPGPLGPQAFPERGVSSVSEPLGGIHHCLHQTFRPWKALHLRLLFYSSLFRNLTDWVVPDVQGLWLLQRPLCHQRGILFVANGKKGSGLRAEGRHGRKLGLIEL